MSKKKKHKTMLTSFSIILIIIGILGVLTHILPEAQFVDDVIVNGSGVVGAKLSDTDAKVNSIASWPSDVDDNKYNMAILEEKADDNGAYMTLATVRDVGENPNLEEIDGVKVFTQSMELIKVVKEQYKRDKDLQDIAFIDKYGIDQEKYYRLCESIKITTTIIHSYDELRNGKINVNSK